MVFAELIWGLLAVVLASDARRISGRLRAVPRLGCDAAPEDERLQWVVAPGVTVPPETAAAARAHMKANGLAALELLPGRLSLATLWSLAYHLDPQALRANPRKQGESGMHAFAAPRTVLEAMGAQVPVEDLATFVSLSREVRRRVGGRHDFAIAPAMAPHPFNPFFQAGALEVVIGGSIRPVLLGIPVATLVLVLGLFVAPIMGTVALMAYLVQQPVSILSSGFTVRWPWLQGLVRIPVDLRQWYRLLQSTTALCVR